MIQTQEKMLSTETVPEKVQALAIDTYVYIKMYIIYKLWQ